MGEAPKTIWAWYGDDEYWWCDGCYDSPEAHDADRHPHATQYTRTDTLGWQTVETAPNEGPKVWTFGEYSEDPRLSISDGDWWRREKKIGSRVITHWMHQVIPKPPTGESK